MPRAWYVYNGQTPVTAAGSWSYIPPIGDFPGIECIGPTTLCAISCYYPFAEAPQPNPLSPLSSNIRAYINLAQSTSANAIPQTGKPYLYKKSN